jgi:hypothetical protein
VNAFFHDVKFLAENFLLMADKGLLEHLQPMKRMMMELMTMNLDSNVGQNLKGNFMNKNFTWIFKKQKKAAAA